MSLPVSPYEAVPASLSDTAAAAPSDTAPETPPDTAPETPPDTAPETAPDPASEAPPLSLRQEAFCRHYAATGNAAGAARAAGYAEGSARQTGHDLLERPAVAGRVCAIRQAWRATMRAEAQILLGRLEQAWDAAVARGSASLMLRVIKLQAELSGLGPAHRPVAAAKGGGIGRRGRVRPGAGRASAARPARHGAPERPRPGRAGAGPAPGAKESIGAPCGFRPGHASGGPSGDRLRPAQRRRGAPAAGAGDRFGLSRHDRS